MQKPGIPTLQTRQVHPDAGRAHGFGTGGRACGSITSSLRYLASSRLRVRPSLSRSCGTRGTGRVERSHGETAVSTACQAVPLSVQSSRSLLRKATGCARVSVGSCRRCERGSMSLSVRSPSGPPRPAPTHVRMHTHTYKCVHTHFPRPCLGPARVLAELAPCCARSRPRTLQLPSTPHCLPGMRRHMRPLMGAGCGNRGSCANSVTDSRGAGALGRQLSAWGHLTRVSSQPPPRPKITRQALKEVGREGQKDKSR